MCIANLVFQQEDCGGVKTRNTLLNDEEKEKWIENEMQRETTVAGQWVEDADTTIKWEGEDRRSAESGGLRSREARQTFEGMLNAIRESLRDLAISDYFEDEEVDEGTDQRKQSEHDKHGWVRDTILETVQQRMESSMQRQVMLDAFPHPGWGDKADNLHEGDKQYGTSELKVPAVLKPYTDSDVPSPAPLSLG